MSVKPNRTLDAKNLACPMPVLKSKKTLNEMKIGEILEIIATDPGSMKDIPSWCRSTGQDLVLSEEQSDKTFRFLVKRVK